MTTNMVLVAGILERLRYSFPEANSESESIAKVNHVLHPILEMLKQIIEYADEDHFLADEMAKSFGRQMMRVLYDFEDLMESYVLEFISRKKRPMNSILKRSRKKKIRFRLIEKLREDLAHMINQASNPSITSLIHLADENKPNITVESLIYGRELGIIILEDAKKELVSALIEGTPNLNLVSICGMPGIGKTFLAKKIFSDPIIQYHFSFSAWVSVSQEYQRRDILRKIYSGITSAPFKESEEMSEDNLAESIYEILNRGKYLIVLDEIWDADVWFSLRMVFPVYMTRSRIIITTQLKDVALQVGGPKTHIHMMRTLTDEESLKLLRHELPENLAEQFDRKIISSSGGLPLAITELASTLRLYPLEEWNRRIKHLFCKSAYASPLYYVFDVSYKNLPLHLKACLLYLGNYFPEEAEIEMDTVCQLLIAEGLVLIEDKRNGETIMDVAALYLDELDNRSLVQILEEDAPGKRFKSCRIHKVIKCFCKYNKGKEDEFFEAIDLGDENESMSSATRIAIHLHEYECSYAFLNEKPDYLRSLLLLNSSPSEEGYIRPREIPDLDNLIMLRVLYLYAVDLKSGKLPKGLEKLVHLRYLSFRECYLEELPSSISHMFYLQTLDLRVRNECQVIIPDVLNALERLRYLYLPLAFRTLNKEKLHLGRLKELELLENFNDSLCNVMDLRELTNLVWLTITSMGDDPEIGIILDFVSYKSRQLLSTSLHLRDFDCYTTERFSVLKNVFSSNALHTLGVEGYLKKLPEFDRTSSKLTEIVLNSSELVEDPMQILQELPNLRILVLEIEAYKGTKMTCSFGFPELRYLKLSKLYKLQDLEVQNQAMPNLCTLIIENCSNLQELPEGLRFRTKLEKLEITPVPNASVVRTPTSRETEVEERERARKEDPQTSSTL